MEFKLPKKFDDGFNRAAVIDESVTEEDEASPQLKKQNLDNKNRENKSSAASKKVGKFQKKPSPLTLTRDERVDEKKEEEREKIISTKQTVPASVPASKQGVTSGQYSLTGTCLQIIF